MPPKKQQQRKQKPRTVVVIKKKQVKNPKPKTSARMSTRMSTRLSECALKYALAITCPFDPRAYGVCNPAGRESFTFPTHSHQRIICTIGTAGTGFALISPSMANDAINCFYTRSTFTGTDSHPCSANNTLVTGVSAASPVTLPFDTDDMANSTDYDSENVTGRIVAVGISCSYIGTELNKGGLTVGLHDPNHMSVSGADVADIGSYQQAIYGPNAREPTRLAGYALSDDEDQCAWQRGFASTSGTSLVYPWCNGNISLNTTFKGPTAYAYANASGVDVGSPPMVVMFTGTAGQTVLVEIITHVEYAGKKAQSQMRRAHTDVQGAATVKIAAGTVANKVSPEPRSASQYWREMAYTVGSVSRDFAMAFLEPELSRLSIMN